MRTNVLRAMERALRTSPDSGGRRPTTLSLVAQMDDWREVAAARIRGLQGIYTEAHEALRNWGAWSRDRRGIFPTLTPPAMWDQFKRDGTEGYADEGEREPEAVETPPAKAEAAEREPYQELPARVLDERMHSPGGLNNEIRRALRIAYVSVDIPEYQFATLASCGGNVDRYCERLEEALRFVGRFL